MINRTDPVTGNVERAIIDKIMAKRMNPRKKENEYLVKWESKPQTWEPASHLDTCKDLIEKFEVLLAKQKEMRAKTQLSQQQQAQPSATSTPTVVAQQVSTQVANSTPTNRPERSSKAKAINQVKQWTGGNKSETDITVGKRKMEEEDDYEEMDGDDVDDEDYQLESSWEKKKMAQQLGQVGNKKLKTDTPGQNGAVRVVGGKQDLQIGATVVRKVVGTKSPDVVIAGQKQMSGVFKKAAPGPATAIVKKPGEGQVRIVEKKDQIQSGIVRVGQSPTTVVTANLASPRQTIQSRVVPKPSPVVARQTGQTGAVVRSAQAVQAQQKTLAQKIMQRSPVNKSSPVVQRQTPANQSGVVVRRSGTVQTQVVRKPGTPAGTPQGKIIRKPVQNEEDDDGIQDPFPKDLPPIEPESESPPPPLTLCPITGKVLGQAEGEPEGTATEEQEVDADQHQITQLLSNEDGTPIYITGDDGTMYQVAGKNAKGETILVSTNAEGEQTCVLLPADQDLLAGLPGIQTSDVTEAAVEGTPMTVDAAVAEAVSAAEQTQEEAQFDEASQGSQGAEDATAPLSVAVGGESGDSQDGQITAEIVQADEPSPGKIETFNFYFIKIINFISIKVVHARSFSCYLTET